MFDIIKKIKDCKRGVKMGIFDKFQKNVLDRIDTKMNEASDYISKKQEKLNNLDMNDVNNKFLEKFTPKAELFEGDDNLPEKNNKFVCFSCGSDDSIGSKKTERIFSGADEIRKYKELMDDGIITKEEFEKKKADILGF